MKRKQFEPLVVHDFEAQVFHLPEHTHNYYELIYIRNGSGKHFLNKNSIEYNRGDLYLICPEDMHYFKIEEKTHFTYIKFTDSYFPSYGNEYAGTSLRSSPQQLMRNKLFKEIKLSFVTPYSSLLIRIIQNIVEYSAKKCIISSPIIYHQILALFAIVQEVAVELNARIDGGQPEKEELLSYIHQHISAPERLKIKNVATHFHIAQSYFSDHFKRRFGTSYRTYINNYRLALIENRLLLTTSTSKEIAAEFGFTDESHFSHFFKVNRKLSPSAFKRLNSINK